MALWYSFSARSLALSVEEGREGGRIEIMEEIVVEKMVFSGVCSINRVSGASQPTMH
jgi:hypothetical protein